MNEEEQDLIKEVAFGEEADFDPVEWLADKNLSRESLEQLAYTIIAQCFDRSLGEAGIKDLLVGESGEGQVRYIGKEELDKIFEAINNGLLVDLVQYLEASIGYAFHIGYAVAEKQLQAGSYQPNEETGQPPQ